LGERPDPSANYPKTAACICGKLTVSVSAPPQRVHACTCLDCQRRSGSAFSYTAFFADTVAAIAGEARSFRRIADSGRWHEANFCPSCGCTMFVRMEAMPGVVAIPAGCFAEPDFVEPGRLYWTVRRHHWLTAPPGVESVDTQ
jgi:hypothetical protein